MDIDVIIPFHGRPHLLRRCLGPLVASLPQMPGDIRVTVCLVDDASPKVPDTEWLTGSMNVKRIQLPRRCGFTESVNHAWNQTSGEIVILLNNDTIPGPLLLMNLITTLVNDETLAAAGPTTDNPKDLFQYRFRAADPKMPKLTPTRYLTAACMALRRSAIPEEHLFDIRYSPGYFEDLDLCCTLHTRGWRLVILEHEFLHHTGAATFADEPGISDIIKTNYTTFTNRWSHLDGQRELDLLLWK